MLSFAVAFCAGGTVKQRSLLRVLRDGIASVAQGMASIADGMASIFNLSPSYSKPPSYEEQFGTDAELLASDRRKIEEDFQALLRRIEKEIRDTST